MSFLPDLHNDNNQHYKGPDVDLSLLCVRFLQLLNVPSLMIGTYAFC